MTGANPTTPIRPVVRATATAALVLIYLVLAAVALEASARFQSYWTSRHNQLVLDERSRRIGLMAAFDATLWETPWWEYKKNAHMETLLDGRVCRVDTNSYGFRSAEIEVPKPAGVFRAVCIGASTTVEGWTNATTYPAILGQRLNELLDTSSIEVVNCGISSLTASGEFQKLAAYLALEPDLVVEYNCINDISGMIPRLMASSPPWQQQLRRSQFLCRLLGDRLLPSDAEVGRRFERRALHYLRALADSCAERGVQVAFCSFAVVDLKELTRSERAYMDYSIKADWQGEAIGFRAYHRWVGLYNRMLEQMCAESGYLYIPVAEHMPGAMEYYADFCHMSEAGITRKADIIAEYLRGPVEHYLIATR